MNQPDRTDADLVWAVLNGAKGDYGDLIRRHEVAVRATALAILRDADMAQDAAQAAFITGYRKLATLRSRDAFGAWVLRIVRHEALRLARARRAGAQEAALEAPEIADDRGGPADHGELVAAVAGLPEHERVVVALHYFDGMPLAEVARILGRPEGTIRKQLSRAHGRLREKLNLQ